MFKISLSKSNFSQNSIFSNSKYWCTAFVSLRKNKEDYLKFKPPVRPKFAPVFPKILLPTVFEKKSLWTKQKVRSGVIGIKVGKISYWDNFGVHQACTIVRIDNLQVISISPNLDKTGCARMLLGCGLKNWNRVNKGNRKLFESVGVPYKAHIREFKVSTDGVLPPGTAISARHFVPGQFVDVRGKTCGKGFQGTIKRHNFRRQPMSHGATKVHRKPGSQGQTGASRVFPGKKGAGRMGGKHTTILNLRILKIDAKRNILYIKGELPGKPGTYLYVRDAIYKSIKNELPYPTFIPDPYEVDQPILEAPPLYKSDPFIENMSVGKLK